MSAAAFWYGLVIATILVIDAPISCLKCISCRCGSSNKNYTHCIVNEQEEEYICKTWAHCQTCKHNTTYCITCPPKQFGPFCTGGEVNHIRKKRQLESGSHSARCAIDGFIDNGRVTVTTPLDFQGDVSEFPVGTRLQYSCNEGYVLQGVADVVCEENGFWSEEILPTCSKAPEFRSTHCENDGYIDNGRVTVIGTAAMPLIRQDDYFELPVGTRLHYSCNEGYVLKGVADVVCEENGFWSEVTKPACSEIRCKKFGPVSNGRVVVYFTSPDKRHATLGKEHDLSYPVGTRLHYTCDDAFMLVGNDILSCESSGRWSAGEPRCVTACGLSSNYSILSSNYSIFRSFKTTPGEWPWTVAIAVDEKNTKRFYCSGVLLDSSTVLTVGHCVQSARDYILYFGLFHLKLEREDSQVQERTSSRIIVHPNFNKKTFENDIALITFDPPVRYSDRIHAICLPTPFSTERNLAPGEKGFVSGWEVGVSRSLSQELSVIQLPVLSEQACTEALRKKRISLSIKPGMFCAGLREGIADFCSMVSGSPMVFYNVESSRYVLEGLVSWGSSSPCQKRENYYVLTRVATFMQWILDKLQK
ncbi:Limulus clotting factor C like protein [Argiope bruennichi]|uniref:Limulus clotting factor C like protein n=1 Tax=Argiope bruennichi TaxID=94029 RepID=A0A8T0ENN2_ARGBR|nr:Limulus clotting factor C like protein [Argiope bruennichi]